MNPSGFFIARIGTVYGRRSMKIVLFGATGMVGQGVLRECLLDPNVSKVVAVGRQAVTQRYSKLHNIALPNMFEYGKVSKMLFPFDACFFCLGVSSAGMTEEDYSRLTYDLTLAAAKTLVRRNRRMTFVYVSGEGTDSSEKGNVMWARVKGRTENALLRLPFKAAYMFRPAYIHPMNGAVSKTPLYRHLYQAADWMYPVMNCLIPNHVTTTEKVGRAMLTVAKKGYEKSILETKDINRIGETESS
jgi:hypothetical protein